ncbi:MAG: hypothetical protein EXR75_17030 [Myxococcales bacterium]|nr:hypothetical protein [Myxococcales bacterium]
MPTPNADSKKTPKKRAADSRRAPTQEMDDAVRGKPLVRLDYEFFETAHEPSATGRAYLGAVLMSLGAVGLGAGAFALLILEGRPVYVYAPYFLVAGIVLVGIASLLGGAGSTVGVGGLGVSVTDGGRTSRAAWYELSRIASVGGELSLELSIERAKSAMVVSLREHRGAAAHIVREALKRVPKRVALSDDEVRELGERGKGKRVSVEPPLATGATCRASKKALTIEKDVRMCARCGVLYHRANVPSGCLECDAQLRTA